MDLINRQIDDLEETIMEKYGISKIIFVQNKGMDPQLTIRYTDKSLKIIKIYPDMIEFLNNLKIDINESIS